MTIVKEVNRLGKNNRQNWRDKFIERHEALQRRNEELIEREQEIEVESAYFRLREWFNKDGKFVDFGGYAEYFDRLDKSIKKYREAGLLKRETQILEREMALEREIDELRRIKRCIDEQDAVNRRHSRKKSSKR